MASPLPPAVVRLLPCGCFYGWVIAAVLTGCQCVSHIGALHLITLPVARIYATFETELGVEPSASASLWMVGCGMAEGWNALHYDSTKMPKEILLRSTLH